MKNKKKVLGYDADYAASPLHTTLKRRSRRLRQIRTHRVLQVVWSVAGILLSGITIAELTSNVVYTSVIRLASDDLAVFFGLDPETLASLASQGLTGWKAGIIAIELFLGALFFVCAWYCRRLIARSMYILQLEEAALTETSQLLREEEKIYAASHN